MTRAVLSTAAALLAAWTFFATAAEACISCEYVPEVVNTPVNGKSYQKKRVAVAARPADVRPARKRLARPAHVIEKVDAPKTEPVAAQEPAGTSRPISTASLLESRRVPVEKTEEVVADLGCKKFFPAVGKTLTVPCE